LKPGRRNNGKGGSEIKFKKEFSVRQSGFVCIELMTSNLPVNIKNGIVKRFDSKHRGTWPGGTVVTAFGKQVGFNIRQFFRDR